MLVVTPAPSMIQAERKGKYLDVSLQPHIVCPILYLPNLVQTTEELFRLEKTFKVKTFSSDFSSEEFSSEILEVNLYLLSCVSAGLKK